MARKIANRKSKIENPLTLAHVTHEAVEQLGGIGTVLEGLITSPVYQRHVKRSILIGPTNLRSTPAGGPDRRLGETGKVLYSSVDKIDTAGVGGRLRPVEWAFDTPIVYGTRSFAPPKQNRQGQAEVLLIDVSAPRAERLAVFKLRLWERFGIDSSRYDSLWEYEEYVRLAEPALYALLALLERDDDPCVLFSHEFMGMPAALSARLDGGGRFRTVFHAHECSTARRLVEDHAGHDTMFYNVMDKARAGGQFVEDVFGKLDHLVRHALVSRSYLCDGVIAVGHRTRDELKFLNKELARHRIDLVYNGIPAMPVTMSAKNKSRAMLADYARALLDYRPDVLMTHVTRPVVSKGLWRDLKVCHELDALLAKESRTAVLFILTSGGGTRSEQDVLRMEREYGWPRHHRVGPPDLMGPEVDIHRMIEPFNANHRQVQVVLVNQFGWSRQRIGSRLPAGMDFADLRRGTDVEFGMATYEPFGISPLEPLGDGALCVISNVCGCEGFVEHVTKGRGCPNVIVADFVRDGDHRTIEQLKKIGRKERDEAEHKVAVEVAAELMKRLPRTEAQRKALLDSGQKLVKKMGWDRVIADDLLPMLKRIVAK